MRRLYPLWKHSRKLTQTIKWTIWSKPEWGLEIFFLMYSVLLTYWVVLAAGLLFSTGNSVTGFLLTLTIIPSCYFMRRQLCVLHRPSGFSRVPMRLNSSSSNLQQSGAGSLIARGLLISNSSSYEPSRKRFVLIR